MLLNIVAATSKVTAWWTRSLWQKAENETEEVWV